MNGQIVRGIAGRRDEYRPIVSDLVDSAEPLAVAQALHGRFGFSEFYLADLDAILHEKPADAVYRALHAAGFRLWIDAGLRSRHSGALDMMMHERAASIVIGLESVAGPADVREIVTAVGVERAVFSLDLQRGRPIGRIDLWQTDDAFTIAERSIAMGVGRMIVLDLANVGVGAGVGTEDLCVRIKRAYPTLQLTAGGGVRGISDVNRLTAIGVDYVLVASALHDGRIPSEPEA